MIVVTTVHNPFNELENTVEVLEHKQGGVVSDYLPALDQRPGLSFVVAVNGHVVDPPYDHPVSDGDKIAVSAKTEYSASVAIAGWAATAATGAATLTAAAAYGGIVSAMAYAAVYGVAFVGSMMVIGYGMSQLASALGPDMPDTGGADTRESPTYGWGTLQQTETQDNPIQVLFGKQKVAGQVINQFKTIGSGNKEYIHILLAVAGHEVDSITDIRINDQPYTNFKGVEVYTRLGTLNDDPIPGFGQIVQLQNVGVSLNGSSDTHTTQTDGNSVEEIQLAFVAQSGLYYSNDDGGLDERHVDFKIEYRAIGASEWNVFKSEYRIKGATTEAIRKSTTISGLTPDQYEVKVTRLTEESTSFRENTTVSWSQMSEVINEGLLYPGVAKYAITALATDQLSGGVPAVSCTVTRSQVEVYVPDTGIWVYASAYNPAWAAYWLLNTHHGIHHSRLIYSEFKDWADWCDEITEDETRILANVYLDTVSNAWRDVQKIARLGRASIVRRGTKYGVFVDKPESVVSHLFTAGNIISETYSMNYLPLKDRANACEVTYNLSLIHISEPTRPY